MVRQWRNKRYRDQRDEYEAMLGEGGVHFSDLALFRGVGQGCRWQLRIWLCGLTPAAFSSCRCHVSCRSIEFYVSMKEYENGQ